MLINRQMWGLMLLKVKQLLGQKGIFQPPHNTEEKWKSREVNWFAVRHRESKASQSLLKLMSIELVMPSIHLNLCNPLLPPSIFPNIRVFSNESVPSISWSQYFRIGPSNEYSGLVSFRIDWLDLLAVQGALKSLLQHHSSKASIWCSAFFIVQLSYPYMTTGKTIALAKPTFVGKVMSAFYYAV